MTATRGFQSCVDPVYCATPQSPGGTSPSPVEETSTRYACPTGGLGALASLCTVHTCMCLLACSCSRLQRSRILCRAPAAVGQHVASEQQVCHCAAGVSTLQGCCQALSKLQHHHSRQGHTLVRGLTQNEARRHLALCMHRCHNTWPHTAPTQSAPSVTPSMRPGPLTVATT